ncbi:MAG: lysophospholipid acyltransferase family protein [Gammaproteobacteria bacterium]
MIRVLRALWDYAVTYVSMALFAATCLVLSAAALPLYALLPRRNGVRIGRLGISLACRLYGSWLTLVGAYRLDLDALDTLRDEPGIILAPNHPSIIDAILILSRHPNVTCVMKSDLMNNVFLGGSARLAGYICNRPPRRMVRDSVAELRRGSTLLLFPEGTRTVQPPVNCFTSGVGLIAKRAGVPVQALILEANSPCLSKGWSPVARTCLPVSFRVRLGRRFEAPQDARTLDRALEAYFREELADSPQNGWLAARPLQQQPG